MSLKRPLVLLCIAFCLLPSFLLAQTEKKDSILPKIETKRQIPKSLNTGFWLGAYIGSIYLLSRTEIANAALGVFYLIPASVSFDQIDSEIEIQDNSFFKGENMGFISLSTYNFLRIDPEKQSSTEIFRDNIFANLSVFGGLYLYRKYAKDSTFFFLPVLSSKAAALQFHYLF